MNFSSEALLTWLQAHLPESCSGLVVSFSGGLDSTVLLHALASTPRRWPVRAVHVNHQLHPDSLAWCRHCERQAEALNVRLETVAVRVTQSADLGVEAAARKARYDALRSQLHIDECLLTAHHADDQAETLLLALVRGTGVRGLAGMPVLRAFGVGHHARPLLDYTRGELARYATAHSLLYLDDPANLSDRFARNHVRSRVLPAVRERWPRVARQFSRAAANLAEASELLDQLAQLDAAQCLVSEAIDVTALRQLSVPRRKNLLRWWLRRQGARAPGVARLQALLHDMEAAAADRVPHADVDQLRVFRHRAMLYAVPLVAVQEVPPAADWNPSDPFELPTGALMLERAVGEGIDAAVFRSGLQVRYRAGGERLRVHPDGPHRALKKLLQEAGVLPWWRDRIPLICSGDRLLAVADLWVNAEVAARRGEAGVVIRWQDRPALFAQRSAHIR